MNTKLPLIDRLFNLLLVLLIPFGFIIYLAIHPQPSQWRWAQPKGARILIYSVLGIGFTLLVTVSLLSLAARLRFNGVEIPTTSV